MTTPSGAAAAWFGRRDPDARGYFGSFGGRFVPETLVAPIQALEQEYLRARADERFAAELSRLLTHYVGRADAAVGRAAACASTAAARGSCSSARI